MGIVEPKINSKKTNIIFKVLVIILVSIIIFMSFKLQKVQADLHEAQEAHAKMLVEYNYQRTMIAESLYCFRIFDGLSALNIHLTELEEMLGKYVFNGYGMVNIGVLQSKINTVNKVVDKMLALEVQAPESMKEIFEHNHQVLNSIKESIGSMYKGLGEGNYTIVKNSYDQIIQDTNQHMIPILIEVQRFQNTFKNAFNIKDGQ